MSKNTSMRYCTKLDFGVTCRFGHRTCNSGPFLFKIGSKCAHYWDVLRTGCNLFTSVGLRAVLSGFSFPKSSNCNWWFGFLQFGPVQFRFFSSCVNRTFKHYPHLTYNFPNSIFPAASFNCGPRTVSLDHTDFNNLSHGLCALTALGDYDHTVGGHLILFGLKLDIQFPVGSTALIPSGCVSHGNTPICEGEIQLSIVQYAAGGLFRWVTYGFQSAKTLLKIQASRKLKKWLDKEAGEWWREGLAMFSKVGELQADAEDVCVG